MLRQLIAHIGDEAFVAGVGDYLRGHAFGNGELAEFLDAVARAAGRDLDDWAQAWLRTAGADRLALGRDGVLTRTTPAEHPAERPHTLDVAAFDGEQEVLREQVVLDGARVEVPGVADLPPGVLLVPNARDLTWAEVALDDATVHGAVTGLADLPDPMARTVVWTSLIGGMHRAEVDPRRLLEVVENSWAREDDASVLSRVAAAVTGSVVPLFLRPEERDEALERVAGAADELADRADGADGNAAAGLALAAARVWARSGSDVARLHRWAAGEGLPPALARDDDFRWLVLRRLSALDALTDDELTAAEEADRSLAGRLAALGVRAVRPTAEAKEWAWSRLHDDAELSNYAALELARGFWAAPEPELVRPYVDRVGDLLAHLGERMGEDALSRVATALHPKPLVEEASLSASTAMLERDDLSPGVRRALLDEDHVLREALASRRRFD